MTDFLDNSLFFGTALTIVFYAVGLAVKRRLKLAIFNPLLVAAICIIAFLGVTGIDYSYYAKGAEQITFFLTPATVCLALPLYDKLRLLRDHWRAVLAAIVAGIVVNGVGILLLCGLFSMPRELTLSLLPKSVTTAIGLGLSEELGGVVSITVAAIAITGIGGSIAAEWVFRAVRIREPIAKGLAIGTASHAIGTSKAMELGQVEGAMSSLALVVTGLITVLAAPLFASFV